MRGPHDLLCYSECIPGVLVTAACVDACSAILCCAWLFSFCSGSVRSMHRLWIQRCFRLALVRMDTVQALTWSDDALQTARRHVVWPRGCGSDFLILIRAGGPFNPPR